MRFRPLFLTALFLPTLLATACDEPAQTEEVAASSRSELSEVGALSRLEAQHAAESIRFDELSRVASDLSDDARLGELDLSNAERDVLDEILAEEQSPTLRTLLQRLVTSYEHAEELRQQMSDMRARLPVPQTVLPGDTHLSLAVEYLVGAHGFDRPEADALARSTLLTDELHPGMEVWHMYDNGVYGAMVTQGSSDMSPYGAVRAARLELEGDLTNALSLAYGLQIERADLTRELDDVTGELDEVSSERDALQTDVAVAQYELKRSRFAISTIADLRKSSDLRPMSRRLKDFPEERLNREFIPRPGTVVVVTAAELGLDRIRAGHVLPEGVFHAGEDFEFVVTPSGTSASLNIRNPARFEGESFVIAVK